MGLDDGVFGVLLDDVFEFAHDMAGCDEKAPRLRAHGLVLVGAEQDEAVAAQLSALAENAVRSSRSASKTWLILRRVAWLSATRSIAAASISRPRMSEKKSIRVRESPRKGRHASPRSCFNLARRIRCRPPTRLIAGRRLPRRMCETPVTAKAGRRYVPCMARVEAAFLHAAAVHDSAAGVHDRAAEVFDGLAKSDLACRERERARVDRDGAAADRERARLRHEWLASQPAVSR